MALPNLKQFILTAAALGSTTYRAPFSLNERA